MAAMNLVRALAAVLFVAAFTCAVGTQARTAAFVRPRAHLKRR
jgi:hypothetical protein